MNIGHITANAKKRKDEEQKLENEQNAINEKKAKIKELREKLEKKE